MSMNVNDRLLDLWVDITGLVLPLLVMLAIVLGWSAALQIALTVVAGVAIYGTRIALSDQGRRVRRRLRG